MGVDFYLFYYQNYAPPWNEIEIGPSDRWLGREYRWEGIIGDFQICQAILMPFETIDEDLFELKLSVIEKTMIRIVAFKHGLVWEGQESMQDAVLYTLSEARKLTLEGIKVFLCHDW